MTAVIPASVSRAQLRRAADETVFNSLQVCANEQTCAWHSAHITFNLKGTPPCCAA